MTSEPTTEAPAGGPSGPPGALAEKMREHNFTTDEKMMFHFKVDMCTDEEAHDWLECPYSHRGEKAARRDPRKHNHIAVICPDIRRSGRCPRGDNCPYAHSVFELHLHPSRYRTLMCTMGASCRRTVCFFAHSPEELRQAPPEEEDPALPEGVAGAAPKPRGLSFDLAADGGAPAAAALRAVAAQPGAGRASLETAAAAAAAAAAAGGAAAGAPALGLLASRGGSVPARLPTGRASFDALTSRAAAAQFGDMPCPPLKRLSLPSLLPAELGFTAADESGTPTAQGPGLGPGPISAAAAASLLGHHPQQVRAAIALLERSGSGGASAVPTAGRGVNNQRRAGLDGGSRPSPPPTTAAAAGSPAAWSAQAAASDLFAPFNQQQQQMLSALLVQQQYEQMAAQQCEILAAQHRERLAAQQQKQQQQVAAATAAAQLPPPFPRQPSQQHLQQLQQKQQQQQLALQAKQQAAEEEQQAAALAALWVQERRAAAAAAAAVAAAQQESEALAALRWSLAQQQQQRQQQVAVASLSQPQQGALNAQLLAALAASAPTLATPEIAVGGAATEYAGLVHHLSEFL